MDVEIKIFVPKYSTEDGIEIRWDDSANVTIAIEDGAIALFANKAGLVSLANLFANLSQDDIPVGHHVHLDEHNSLEVESVPIIIGKQQ